jgi:transposase-like protein
LGDAAPLSPASLARLKAHWQLEDEAWKRRRLDDLEGVYVWAGGLYVKAGLEDTKAALLVLIGALTTGQKGVLAVESGRRESKESWGAVLRDLRARGLTPWRCTIADGPWGIWAALGEQQPTTAEQRCWNHRITNVLDAIPKKHQPVARPWLCARPEAESRAACEKLRTQFAKRYRQLAPKAVERLECDWERLVTCYQCPGTMGATCGPRTWSSRPSGPSDCAQPRPTASRKLTRRPPGSGKSSKSPRRPSAGSMPLSSCRRSMPACSMSMAWNRQPRPLQRRLPPDAIYTLIDKTSDGAD